MSQSCLFSVIAAMWNKAALRLCVTKDQNQAQQLAVSRRVTVSLRLVQKFRISQAPQIIAILRRRHEQRLGVAVFFLWKMYILTPPPPSRVFFANSSFPSE